MAISKVFSFLNLHNPSCRYSKLTSEQLIVGTKHREDGLLPLEGVWSFVLTSGCKILLEIIGLT